MRIMGRVPGRHRRTFNLKTAGILGASLAIVVVLGGTYVGYQQLSGNDCTGQIKLNVAAATEIAPAVDRTAQKWVADGANVNGTCVSVAVTGVDPATMAGARAHPP